MLQLQTLNELIKICYIRTHEKLQRERDRIIEKTTELEEIIKSNYRKFDQDSMKTLRKYLEEQNAEARHLKISIYGRHALRFPFHLFAPEKLQPLEDIILT